MVHAAVALYVVVALNGFVALTVSVLGTITSRIRSYWLLVGFYGLLTIRFAIAAVENYVSLLADPVSTQFLIATDAVAGGLTAVFMLLVTLYFHSLFLDKYRRVLDWVAAAAWACVLVINLAPGLRATQVGPNSFDLTLLGRITYCVHLALFFYVLVLGVAGWRRDRSPRELVLIWSLIVLGVVAFVTDLVGLIQYFANPSPLSLEPSSLVATAIPHFLFGGVLMYYFGSYVLANRSHSGNALQSLVDRHGISPREREIIEALNLGLSNREIAEKLFVSLATVKTHVHNVYEKTGATGRYDLFRMTRQ